MYNKRSVYYLTLFAVFGSPLIASAVCAPLTRTLKIGMKGEDVHVLQRALNSNSETIIAKTGPGSPGNETMFFGAATEKAVKKFQSVHASEVLTPAGVRSPTGVVGKFTRDVLNQKACAAGITAVSGDAPGVIAAKKAADVALNREKVNTAVSSLMSKLTSNSILDQLGNISSRTGVVTSGTSAAASSGPVAITGTAGKYPLQLFTLSPMVVLRGTKIGLMGTGFSSKTRLRIGTNTYDLNGGTASDTATFVVPSDYAYGNYTVTLEDSGTVSNSRSLVVAPDLNSQPVIESVSPDSGNVGTIITIKGTHFASKNDIVTSIGTIHDVSSSDGNTLSFTLTANNTLLNKDGKILPYLPFQLSVINMYGTSGFKGFNIR